MEIESLNILVRRLWHHLELRRRIQLLSLLFLMIFASIAEIASIGAVIPFLSVLTSPEQVFENELVQPIINFYELKEPSQLLLPLTVMFGAAAVLSGLMRLILVWSQSRYCHALGHDFSMSMYHRTLYQQYKVHVSRNSSEVIVGISNKANLVVYTTLQPILTLITSVALIASILSIIIAVDPIIAIYSFIGFGSIYCLVILGTKNLLTRDGSRVSKEQNRVMKSLQEGLGGIRDVLIDGTQSNYEDIYRNADLPLKRAQSNIQIVSSIPRFGAEALGMVLIAILAYSQSGRPEGLLAIIPVLGALALGAQRLLPVLQQAYQAWSLLQSGKANMRDTLDLLEQPLPEKSFKAKKNPIKFEKVIDLKGLSFRYSSDTPWVLRNLDLEVLKGKKVGFIGSTGCGKSTLLDILMGLLEPTEGFFSVDGVKITSKNHEEWRMNIAHVPQTVFLADTTILENIAFGIPAEEINYDLARDSAKKAQIAETIESWDLGYQTRVGERGVRISGGQRQRIGIARAMYKKASIIVLDEATSALDGDTEQSVMNSIQNIEEGVTMILVAHRLTTLKGCDQIVEIENGQVKRIGSYQEIIDLA